MKRLALVMLTLLATTLASTGFSASKDVDWERLSRSLAQLSAEPNLGRLAAPEIERAQAALLHLKENGRGKKRAHLLYLAERRVDIAWARAQLVDLERQQTELAREHDRLLIAAARHDAEQARLELDRLRLQAQIRAEESERQAEDARLLGEQQTAAAQAEADQAKRLAEAQARETALARKEAELAGAAADALRVRLNNLRATRGARGMQMTLEDVAFASGQSQLRAEARDSISKLVEFVQADPEKRIRIEGHTDSTGSANANQVLAQRRAEAIEKALRDAGIDPARMTAVGIGEDQPIASNDTEDGRARNRRVEIILEEKQ
ncbi:MAG: OmpA family protein [Dokdonella sp.]|uniref:OmpA family protein n=1 Tax=Dokdonella sp. TaxID=2291710 RepID=UPI0025C4DA35|nr:OmpA family protein [Dokdonella sp.]MBK8123124.1 OmpA family protein [Dokdonella sp.]HQX34630.1 OmpA family protein [Dokdonella sp.]